MLKFVVPWRSVGDPWRDKAQAWQEKEFQRLGLPYAIATDPLEDRPFSVARAMNNYLKDNEHDFIVFGADHVPSVQVFNTTQEVLETKPYYHPYNRTWELSQESTEAVYAGEQPFPKNPVLKYVAKLDFCTGLVAMKHSTWKTTPWDNRFEGWGWEDTAQRDAMRTIFGSRAPGHEPLLCLYHPHVGRGHPLAVKNSQLYYSEYHGLFGKRELMGQLMERVRKMNEH